MKRLIEELEPGFETFLLAANTHASPTEEARNRALFVATGALTGAAGIAALASASKAGPAGGIAAQTTGASMGIVGSGAGTVAKVVGVVAWKSVAIGALVGGLLVGAGVEGARSFDSTSGPADGTRSVPSSSVPTPARPLPAPLVLAPPPPRAPSVASPLTEPSSSPAPASSSHGQTAARATERDRVLNAEARTDATGRELASPPFILQEPRTPQPNADLAAEVRSIDRARLALDARDFAGCLKELQAYETTHPQGSLSVEAEVLRIGALSEGGSRTEATERTKRFLLSHPDGPYRARLQKVLRDGAPP